MDRVAVRVAVAVGALVAAVLSSSVLLRAAWLLPPGFDPDALLVRYGSGPVVGLARIALGALAIWLCRKSVRQMLRDTRRVSPVGVAQRTTKFALLGAAVGLVVGTVVAWLAIRLDGMGNHGDTGIVQFEAFDFVEASMLGLGVFAAASASAHFSRNGFRTAWMDNRTVEKFEAQHRPSVAASGQPKV